MQGDLPPSRYRIVERDRRLVVVDRWATAAPAEPEMAPTGRKRRMNRQIKAPSLETMPGGKLRQVAFDGRTAFTTHRLFDTKGPRTLILDPGSASAIGGVKIALIIGAAVIVGVAVSAPYFLLPLIMLLQKRVRDGLRTATTAWLDRASNTAT